MPFGFWVVCLLFVGWLVGWLVLFNLSFHNITRSYGYSQRMTKASVVLPAWEEMKIVEEADVDMNR
jgi:hypothetical protein